MRNLLAAAWLCALTASAVAAEPSPGADQPKITVNGESLVYAKPDKIILNLGIETRDAELLAARISSQWPGARYPSAPRFPSRSS
jgi:uncharacterized protein YggE